MKLFDGTWLVPAALVAACEGSATRPASPVPILARDDAPVQTDAVDYELRYGSGPRYVAQAIVTYSNATPTTIYLDRLSGSAGPLLFELAPAWPGSFGVAVSQVFIGTGSIAISVPAGATRIDTLALELQDINQPNRLKTLLDALKAPREPKDLEGIAGPVSGETPFFCLFDDDKLVTRLNVETDRLLEAGVPNSLAVVVVRVETKQVRHDLRTHPLTAGLA